MTIPRARRRGPRDDPQDDNKLIAQRREKLAQLRAQGNAFPNDFRRDALAADLQAQYGDWTAEALEEAAVRVTVAGRLMSRRVMGKASFSHLQDMSGRIQLFVQRDTLGEDAYAAYKRDLDIGDIVGARGPCSRPRPVSCRCAATSLRLLTKALRPLPEKWHGLADMETRYRQRYVDLIVNESTRNAFRTRIAVIAYIRDYLNQPGFPGGGDADDARDPGRRRGAALRHPSQRARHEAVPAHRPGAVSQAAGGGRLRAGLRDQPQLPQRGPVHPPQPRVHHARVLSGLRGLPRPDGPDRGPAARHGAVRARRHRLRLSGHPLRFRPALRAPHGARGRAALQSGAHRGGHRRPGRRPAQRRGPGYSARSRTGAWAASISRSSSRPASTSSINPTFITEYPTEVSPLARSNDQNPLVTDRFEFFIGGREIANGFSELNDPEDQAERFRHQVAQKDAGDEEAMYYDADYIRALEYGLPPTAGEGIGIDRLVMLFTDSPSIRDVLLFPHMRPED